LLIPSLVILFYQIWFFLKKNICLFSFDHFFLEFVFSILSLIILVGWEFDIMIFSRLLFMVQFGLIIYIAGFEDYTEYDVLDLLNYLFLNFIPQHSTLSLVEIDFRYFFLTFLSIMFSRSYVIVHGFCRFTRVDSSLFLLLLFKYYFFNFVVQYVYYLSTWRVTTNHRGTINSTCRKSACKRLHECGCKCECRLGRDPGLDMSIHRLGEHDDKTCIWMCKSIIWRGFSDVIKF